MPGGNLTRNTAAQVARVMELDHVDYYLENWKGFLCSVCKLFTSEQESFVPAYVAYPFQKPQEFLRNAKDSSFYEPLLDLLVFDAVIANQDRHFGNFGFIRDNASGELLRMAPIFDNGMSLLHQAMEDDLNDLNSYLG